MRYFFFTFRGGDERGGEAILLEAGDDRLKHSGVQVWQLVCVQFNLGTFAVVFCIFTTKSIIQFQEMTIANEDARQMLRVFNVLNSDRRGLAVAGAIEGGGVINSY